MRNLGRFTIFMIAAVAVGIFALPTAISVGAEQYIFLAIVVILIAIISVLISR